MKESVLRDKELQEKVAAVIIANADAAGKRKPPRNRNKRNNQNLNVDLIDLVSSPILNIPGVVNLDSDDEFTETATKYKKDLTEACSSSLGAENEEIKVFVKFESEIEDYLLRPVSITNSNIFEKISYILKSPLVAVSKVFRIGK